MSRGLDELRTQIAHVDAEILRLMAERLRLARNVGAAKRASALPIRSFSAEVEVLERYRDLATRLDIDAHLAEQVARHLIAAAVRLQEEASPSRVERASRILIVGGAGKMGRWLARFFAGQGHAVTTLDPAGTVDGLPSASDLAVGLTEAEIVLVATPLSSGRPVLTEILAREPRSLVVDIFSLKSHVLDLLTEAASRGLRVASLHPLFGPEVRTLSSRVMAVCDCGNGQAADQAAGLFADTALTMTRLPVAQHDAFMQYVLGLSHLTAILFFTTLTTSGRSFAELAGMASTTFFKEARTAAEVSRENPYLYYEIQHLNRHSAELFTLVRQSLAAVEDAAFASDPTRFVELMQQGRAWFPGTLPTELG